MLSAIGPGTVVDVFARVFMATAGSLAFRGIRILRRSSRDISLSATASCHRLYSGVPENEVCVTAAIEENVKKHGGKAKKTIAERFMAAVEKLHDRRLPPELRRGVSIFGGPTNDPIRAEADVVNVAERRIVQSILNGDFENLPGKGKPLKLRGNPHADPAEDMAYRILARNGFAPEWVQLNKEIRLLIQKWRASLSAAHDRRLLAIGDANDTEAVTEAWNCALKHFELELKDINRKVLKYNLLVPFGRQVMSYKLEKELLLLQESQENPRRTSQHCF